MPSGSPKKPSNIRRAEKRANLPKCAKGCGAVVSTKGAICGKCAAKLLKRGW